MRKYMAGVNPATVISDQCPADRGCCIRQHEANDSNIWARNTKYCLNSLPPFSIHATRVEKLSLDLEKKMLFLCSNHLRYLMIKNKIKLARGSSCSEVSKETYACNFTFFSNERVFHLFMSVYYLCFLIYVGYRSILECLEFNKVQRWI